MTKVALKWGFFTALFAFIWLVLEFAVGIQSDYIAFHPVVTLVGLVIPLLCLYYGMREEKLKDTANFTFMRALLTGLFISVVAAVFAVVGKWAFASWINPDYFSSMIAFEESRALAQGIDVVVAQEEAAERFNIQSYLLEAFIGALVGGTVISAILAFFMRRKATVH